MRQINIIVLLTIIVVIGFITTAISIYAETNKHADPERYDLRLIVVRHDGKLNDFCHWQDSYGWRDLITNCSDGNPNLTSLSYQVSYQSGWPANMTKPIPSHP